MKLDAMHRSWIGRGIVSFVVFSSLTHAIIGRHDADLVATPEQAVRFAAVCKILPDGEGVLVDPTWVLTAAHVATGPPVEKLRARCGGIDYRVVQVVPYPDWEPGHSDVALMRLAHPVQRLTPLEIATDTLTEGAVVFLAGRGDYGDGQRKIVGNDGKLRVANNAVLKLEPDRLFIRLDPPDEGALAAEGISGPGDSGTPIFVDRDGTLQVVGIGSVGISPGPGRYGEYGSRDVFIRTSSVREWIDSSIAGAARSPSAR